ncbi:hypothetical protein [Photorhabdus sp. RW14-46]|nr:hypothetical protein [Photorhabdus sp. RW14-46]
MTGVSECSQQRGNLKDDGYRLIRKTMPYKVTPIKFFLWHDLIRY